MNLLLAVPAALFRYTCIAILFVVLVLVWTVAALWASLAYLILKKH